MYIYSVSSQLALNPELLNVKPFVPASQLANRGISTARIEKDEAILKEPT